MKKVFMFLFMVVFLSGCFPTTDGYKKIVKSWVGAHVDELVSVWGIPNSSFDLSAGGKILEYVHSRTIQSGGYSYSSPQTTNLSGFASGSYWSGTATTYVTQTTPVYSSTYTCKTRFTVNSRGYITKYAFQGNDCTAIDPD